MSTNQRTQQTIKKLQDGLAALLLEKELHKISVSELTQAVKVHRSTFYLHFSDIHELYEQMEQSIYRMWQPLFSDEVAAEELPVFFERITQFFLAHQSVMKVFMSSEAHRLVHARLEEVLYQRYAATYTQALGRRLRRTEQYAVFFCVQGALSLLQKWVMDGFVVSERAMLTLLKQSKHQLDEMIVKQ